MRIKVLAFGQIAEITGSQLYMEATDTAVLKATLQIEFPALADKKYALAINNKVISDTKELSENDVVALMPPYSGG